MGRWIAVTSIGCTCAALSIAACGTASFSGDGGADSSTSSDASEDASATDDSGSDSASDAGVSCPDRWCNCVPKGAAFCDDFDLSGETLGQTWTNDAGFILDDGSVLALATDAASSNPKSLTASVPTDGANRIEAAISVNVGPLTAPLEVAFDMMIPNTLNNCANGFPELLRVGSDSHYVPNPEIGVAFGQQNGALVLFLFAATPTTIPIDASVPKGQWARVRMTAQILPIPDGGGLESLHVSISLDDAGVSDDVDASPIAVATVSAPTPPLPIAWVSMGMLNEAVANTSACQVFIDNVAIYQP